MIDKKCNEDRVYMVKAWGIVINKSLYKITTKTPSKKHWPHHFTAVKRKKASIL